MISVKDLREYCRTCWVKLEIAAEDDATKVISTNKHPELEKLIQVCLAKTTADDDNISCYSPFLCRCCFDKWLDFLKLYQLATKTDEKIRAVLEKEALKLEFNNDEMNLQNSEENKAMLDEEHYRNKISLPSNTNSDHFRIALPVGYDLNEYLINTETSVGLNEVGKCESNYTFYGKNRLNIAINEIKCNEVSNHLNIDSEAEELMNLEIQNYWSDNEDNIVFSPKEAEKQNSTNILNSRRKKKSTSKLLCTLKRENKSKKSLQKACENPIIDVMQNKNNGNAGKKIRYKCEDCNKYFWEKTKYDGHRKQAHEGIRRPYQCLECNKAYNLYKSLLQHKREYHSEKTQEQFKCDECDKIFKTAVILKQHINNKHSEHKQTLRSICDQCGFIAAHQYSLSRHIINKHTETDHIKCDYCPKVFKTRYSLKYHVIGNHNPSNIKPFKCPECQMGFSRKTLLNQHKGTHLKYTERIKCDFEGCEVRFVKHGDKTHHMRLVHLKVKQHICDFCGEAFGAMQTLRHHRFIHTGEKPYKCNICGQGFRQRTAMKTHRKTHDGKNTGNTNLIKNLPEINLSLTSTINL